MFQSLILVTFQYDDSMDIKLLLTPCRLCTISRSFYHQLSCPLYLSSKVLWCHINPQYFPKDQLKGLRSTSGSPVDPSQQTVFGAFRVRILQVSNTGINIWLEPELADHNIDILVPFNLVSWVQMWSNTWEGRKGKGWAMTREGKKKSRGQEIEAEGRNWSHTFYPWPRQNLVLYACQLTFQGSA